MKRISFILVCLLCCIISYAQKITENQARQKAQNFLKAQNKNANIIAQPSKSRGEMQHDSAIYIFNIENNGGFVIVSGDERTDDILGYSDSGHFDMDNLPDNLRAWIDNYIAQINSLKKNENYQKMTRAPKTPIEPLIKTQWGQKWPVNILCPIHNGRRCLTGCVATTMAQIMYYHKWPQTETSEIPAYTTYTYNINMPALPPTIFDWENMPLKVEHFDVVEESFYEEAKLMLYCGQAIDMNYTLDASGASSSDIPKVMAKFFDYNKKAKEVSRNGISSSDWENMLYSELEAKRPVAYSANCNGSGHSFICDGYDGNGLFHINWGYFGDYDGYYNLSFLVPTDHFSNADWREDLSLGYSMLQSAVVGLQPMEEEVAVPSIIHEVGRLKINSLKTNGFFTSYKRYNTFIINVTNTGKSYGNDLILSMNDSIIAIGTVWIAPGETQEFNMSFFTRSVGDFTFSVRRNNEDELYSQKIHIYPNGFVNCDNFYINPGGEYPIMLFAKKLYDDYSQYKFQISLPEGLSIVNSAELSGVTINYNGNNNYSFTCNSNEGNWELFELRVKADEKMAIGDYSIKIDNVYGIDNKGDEHLLHPFEASFRVGLAPEVINVEKEGTLADYIPSEDKYYISRLKIIGKLNGTDFRLLRDMAGNNYLGEETNGRLAYLDISEARIVAGGEPYLETSECIQNYRDLLQINIGAQFAGKVTKRTESDKITESLFHSCKLRTIYLPGSVIEINSAFQHCFYLRKLHIPYGVQTLGPLCLKIGPEAHFLRSIIIPSSVNKLNLPIQRYGGEKEIVLAMDMANKYFDNQQRNLYLSGEVDAYKKVKLIVPKGTSSYYKTAQPWQKFENIEERDFIVVKANDIYIKPGEAPKFTYSVDGGKLNGEPELYCKGNIQAEGKYTIQIRQGTVKNEYVIFEGGTLTVSNSTDINDVFIDDKTADVYDMNGRLVRKSARSLDGLSKGVYIINRKKVVKYQ